jgi:hypothetical protein
MRAFTTSALVRPDHTLTADIPPDVPPGARTVIIVLDDVEQPIVRLDPLNFAPHPVGPADPTYTYRREDIYGDDGR